MFRAFAADTGKLVWSFDAKAPIIATPVSYEAGGRQYLTILTGTGMGISMFAATMIGDTVERYDIDPLSQGRRVLTFALGGRQRLPARRKPQAPPADPGFTPHRAQIQRGYIGYSVHCLNCHGDRAIGMGNGPDLRRSAIIHDKAAFDGIVRGGLLQAQGMPIFPEFSESGLEDIRHYIRSRAAQLRDSGVHE
jgi:quinohemoprotein ethanol dehydrogenase